MKRYQIKDNLLPYLALIGMSINKLEVLCSFSSRYLDHAKFNIPADKVDRILAVLPDLRREWLIEGKEPMTRNIPSSPIADISTPDLELFRERIRCLLEMNGLSVEEYEAISVLGKGTPLSRFESSDVRDLENLALELLKRFPNFSYDWLFRGLGPARFVDRSFIPLIDKPSSLFSFQNKLHQKGGKEDMPVYYATRAFADMRYVSWGNYGVSNTASFAVEIQTDKAAPILNFGDIAICQAIQSPFGENWDYHAAYLVEINGDEAMEAQDVIKIGYLEQFSRAVRIIPFILQRAAKDSLLLNESEINNIAKIVGIIRKL